MRDIYRRAAEWEPLQNGKCKFCGCSNEEGKRQHIRVGKIIDHEDGCELGYGVYCDNCSAQTRIFDKPIGAMASWRAGDYTIPVQSEEQILEGCISLLHELTGVFKDYLDYMGIKQSFYKEVYNKLTGKTEKKETGIDETEIFSHEMNIRTIVNRLFLYHTNHSGGTSTGAKCNELGAYEKYGDGVVFSCMEEEDEDDE